jgi:hypothetical protein
VPLENLIKEKILRLLAESRPLSHGNQHDQCVDPRQQAACSAWLTAAHNVVHLVCPAPDSPYRQKTDRIAGGAHGYNIHNAVAEFAAVLSGLAADAEAGLLSSVADQARVEVFDDFLDQADAYLRDSRKNESGVIAGVVFEDTVRRICRKLGIAEKGHKLDALISELAARDELTAVKAKRARAAADVRTKSTHAQWEEFDMEDVRATIGTTRELLESKLA